MKENTDKQMVILNRKVRNQFKKHTPVSLYNYINDELVDKSKNEMFLDGATWYLGDRLGPELWWEKYWLDFEITSSARYTEQNNEICFTIMLKDKTEIEYSCVL